MNEKVSPYNSHTKVIEVRTDGWPILDLDVAFDPQSDGRKERAEALQKLDAWAKKQVESWQGDPQIKDEILNGLTGLNKMHPGEVIPNLIAIEPLLMLSNLPTEQLTKIEDLLDLCRLGCSDSEHQRVGRAKTIVGAFRLGKETQKAQSIIQSGGS